MFGLPNIRFDSVSNRFGPQLDITRDISSRLRFQEGAAIAGALRDVNSSLTPWMNSFVGPNAYDLSRYGQARTNLSSVMRTWYQTSQATAVQPTLSFQWVAFILGAPTIPWELIVSVTTPSIQYDSKAIYRGGSNSFYAQAYSTDECSMTFITDIGGTVANTVSEWMQGPLRKDGFWAVPKDYKRDAIVYILDPKNTQVYAWTYRGLWAKSVNSYNLQSSSDVLLTEVTFSVDNVEFGVLESVNKNNNQQTPPAVPDFDFTDVSFDSGPSGSEDLGAFL